MSLTGDEGQLNHGWSLPLCKTMYCVFESTDFIDGGRPAVSKKF